MSRSVVIAALAVAALAAAGCGDNVKLCNGADCPDARPQFDGDMTPDAPPANDFTAFVKLQINTNTTDTATPVPFAVFATLPDNDTADDTFQAYADLF
jgi:hypothetical protein